MYNIVGECENRFTGTHEDLYVTSNEAVQWLDKLNVGTFNNNDERTN